jgi:hypothetical protein
VALPDATKPIAHFFYSSFMAFVTRTLFVAWNVQVCSEKIEEGLTLWLEKSLACRRVLRIV